MRPARIEVLPKEEEERGDGDAKIDGAKSGTLGKLIGDKNLLIIGIGGGEKKKKNGFNCSPSSGSMLFNSLNLSARKLMKI